LVSKETSSVLRTIGEDTVELVATPLNAMLNQVGEVSHGAHRDGIFWRVLNFVIAESLVRDDHLRVGFSSKSTGLKEGDFVPNTSLINVSTSVNVVYCVNDKLLAFPELIAEHVFGIFSYACSVGFGVKSRVHHFSDFSSTFRFLLTDVMVSEQELSVEVTRLNRIIISGRDEAVLSATDSHQSEGLNKLAS
jgi:hypothetical protein